MDADQSGDVSDGLQQVQVLQPSDIITSGETITLSLENAAQLILQQSNLQSDEEGCLAPGTYQIITQQLAPSGDGQMQVALANGIRVIQASDSTDLSAYGLGGQGIILQTGAEDTEMLQIQGSISELDENQSNLTVTDTQLLANDSLQQQKEEGNQEEFDGQSEHVLQIDLPVSQSESMLQVINQPFKVETNEQASAIDADSVLVTDDSSYTVSLEQQPEFIVKQEYDNQPDFITEEENEKDSPTDITATDAITDEIPGTSNGNVDGSKPIPTKKPQVKMEKPVKMPDLSKPIEVKDHMEVVVGGKKCLLKVNPETGQLCAYPLISTTPSGKRRGRPKKSAVLARAMEEGKRGEEEDVADTEMAFIKDSDQTNSAAEGLLELSNTGPDGVRRSGRARRKAKTLDDYDMIEVSSDDEGAADEAEDEVLPSGAIRKRKPTSRKEFVGPSPVVPPGIKRGRGRPRRYLKPEETATASQIPAMIIPSGDGQTIMMAPIQGLANLEAFQEQVKNLSLFAQTKTDLTDEASQYLNTSDILSLDAGTQISIHLNPPSDSKEGLDDVGNEDKQDTDVKDVIRADAQSSELSDGTAVGFLATSPSQTDSITLNSVADPSLKPTTSSDDGKATIIQIPENLLPMFMQKKDPVKLGLKASDTHLEQWKCQKCGYQAYYDQQYQNHLLSHPEDTIKCKCCNFVTFEKDDLLSHFKTKHPRCICSVCDHMAEHAYIIKRHLMRHTQEGCTCDICGKVYKDQYVLKMHVKMVHLPAEILFECNVCSKKFTRKAHLKRHLRIHDPQKPFKCPHCQYRGCEKSDISKHLLIHEDPKHVCDVCGKSFRHFKNKELHLKRHTGQRDYKCGVCDFYGYTFTDIRKHIERKHSDTKTYLCDKCGAAFRNEQLLRDHRSQQCEVFMIEQALSIATSDGGTSQATIQIPSTLSLEGQNLQIDGQNISIDNQGHITVEHVNLSEDGIGLSEDQLQAGVVQGHITDTELQSVVSQGQIGDIVQTQGEMIQAIGGVDQESYTGVGEDDVALTEEEEAEDMDMEDEDEMNERMEDMEDDDKQDIVNVNDHMLGMVHIMR